MALRFGIIGCSNVARRRFLPALQKSSGAKLERIGSRDAAKGAEFAAAFPCAKVGSYEAVINDPEVDAVYLSLPAPMRVEWTRKAAECGKHVLCEKPAFANVAAARELVTLCAARKVRLMEGYMFRYHPQHALVKQLVQEGKIGDVRFFTGEFCVPMPPANDIRHKAELGGGVFRDAAGYPVAAAMMHIGSKPVSVLCQAHINPATGVDDAVSLVITFAGGELAQVNSAFGTQYRSQYSLLGREGRIEVGRAYAVNADHRATVTLEAGMKNETFTLDAVDQFQLMIEDFAQQVSGQGTRKDLEADLLRQETFMDAAWWDCEIAAPVTDH
jgi:NDP-hexose-3-ketoreductase